MRDTLKHSIKKKGNSISSHQSRHSSHSSSVSKLEEEDKENNFLKANLPNNFDHIEVGLSKGQCCNEKQESINEKEVGNCSKLMLELQEIKLLEQRGTLVGKRNQRINKFYNVNQETKV